MVAAPAVILGVQIAAAVTAAAGAGIAAYGAVQEGEAAADAAKANAAIAEQQAQEARDQAVRERQRAAAEAEIFAREARRRQGVRISQIGASGLTLSGSGLDILADAALNDEQERLSILHEGDERARARLAGASVEEMAQAEALRQAAAERSAGRFKAAGTLISGLAETGRELSRSPSARRVI